MFRFFDFIAYFLFMIGVAFSFGGMAQAQNCATNKYCTEMTDCAEADFYFRQCHQSDRDRDNDGIPCENVCGSTHEIYQQRLKMGGGVPAKVGAGVSAPAQKYSCSVRKTCKKMASCDEAKFYLRTCKVLSLDRDKDGIPCESICQ